MATPGGGGTARAAQGSLRREMLEPGRADAGGAAVQTRPRVLGVASVVFIVYFNVCGGHGGQEMMSDAGPLRAWSAYCCSLSTAPVALVTSELSSAFPDSEATPSGSGGIRRFWGLSLFCGSAGSWTTPSIPGSCTRPPST